MIDDFKDFIPNVHFEQIPIKNLVSNQNYQIYGDDIYDSK